jgi:HlyD family secretion protein
VRANLLLAGNQLEKVQDELRKAQKKFDNRSSPIWYFVNQRTFRLLLAQLEGEVAQAQRRYDDAAEKLDDLQAPPDAVDVAMAQAGVQESQAKIKDALRRLEELADGPRPKALEQARSRQHSAQAAQRAALQAQEALSLKAPFDSVVVDVTVEPGEWLGARQSAILLAKAAGWIVEARDVDEQSAAGLRPGEAVVVRLDAYPELEIPGRILQIGWLSWEEEGDVYFPLKVELLENDPRLRWGLTARIETSP